MPLPNLLIHRKCLKGSVELGKIVSPLWNDYFYAIALIDHLSFNDTLPHRGALPSKFYLKYKTNIFKVIGFKIIKKRIYDRSIPILDIDIKTIFFRTIKIERVSFKANYLYHIFCPVIGIEKLKNILTRVLSLREVFFSYLVKGITEEIQRWSHQALHKWFRTLRQIRVFKF
ncbi:MAG: hypothetical protein N2511_03210 [Thermodesulfovibrionales bacterium]|nr:hypothetical protein [Thermodesulfovibrionales bacterium]